MEKKRVTIIVAIYKSEKFLQKLIESIIGQTYKNLEIILVDDGSPDNSGKICDEYSKKDKRIKVIHKKNGGTCEARNYGLKAATGDYVTIIDGDDWLSKDYVEYLMNIIESTYSEMAMTDNIFTTRDQNQVKEDKIEVLTPEEATIRLLYPDIAIGPWNKLFDKKVIDKYDISFDVPWSGEGLYFITKFTQRCKGVGLGHRKIYNYRLNNPNSGLTDLNVQMGTNALWNIKNIKNTLFLKTKGLKRACDFHIWKNYCFILYLIVGTSVADNKKLYRECIRKIRIMAPGVAVRSRANFKMRLHIVKYGLFPVTCAKRELRKERTRLANDRLV